MTPQIRIQHIYRYCQRQYQYEAAYGQWGYAHDYLAACILLRNLLTSITITQ